MGGRLQVLDGTLAVQGTIGGWSTDVQMRLGENDLPYGVSGGPVIDPVRGEVIGVLKSRSDHARGGTSTGLEQLRTLPVPGEAVDAEHVDPYQAVFHAHDRYHRNRQLRPDARRHTWVDVQSQLGARPGRTLSPDERVQLLGRLADLPPPVSTRALLDILEDLPDFQAPVPLPAPRGWRDGLGALYESVRDDGALRLVLDYTMGVLAAERPFVSPSGAAAAGPAGPAVGAVARDGGRIPPRAPVPRRHARRVGCRTASQHPLHRPRGVIITSRNPELSEHNSKLLEIPVYARDESVAFIRRRAPRLTEPDADQLAEALEDLPLLLDQTAGWLNDSDLSVDQYIALLEGGIDSDVVKVSADFPLAFQTAWSILLNKLRETVPESVDLLRLCTFFAPGFIPVRLLKGMPGDELPEQLVGLLNDPLLWNKAINQLRTYSVVRLESHEASLDETVSSGESLYLHRMVHQIVHKDMPQDDRREFIDVVRRALAAADPRRPTDPDLWPGCAEIVPHLKYADVLKTKDPQVQRLVLNCLRYMYFSGEYRAGIKLGERAMSAWRTLLGPAHPRIWELTYHYTNLLRALGDYSRTEALSRDAVNRLREERGPQDLEHLRAASGLAADLRGLARYDEALELSQWVLVAYRELLGDQDSRTLNAQNNLAVSLRLLGRYEETLETDRQTMEARRQLLRARHPWTLSSEITYAIDLRLLGRYAEAESIQAKNVRENRLVMGPDNPQTLKAEYNLALCRHRLGERGRGDKRDQPGPMLSSVLERGERVLGETHPLTLIFATSQSCYAREHGDIDQARIEPQTT
jgi:tetratricopeptide (TPR) repeat protein